MKTRSELIDWLKSRGQEIINLDYDLINSLNEPEIEGTVRAMRKHFAKFEDACYQYRVVLERQLQNVADEAE